MYTAASGDVVKSIVLTGATGESLYLSYQHLTDHK